MDPSHKFVFRHAALAFALFVAMLALIPATASAQNAFSIHKQQRIAGSTTVDNNDQLTFQKQERHIDLASGQTSTVSLSCPAGYIVLDGSPVVQSVDQGAGTPADIVILQSESTTASSYTFTLENPTTGNAQAKAFVTCVQQKSTDGGKLTFVSNLPFTKVVGFVAGSLSPQRTITCPSGSIAVDPGYDFTSGEGVVSMSQPSADLGSWTFQVDPTTDGSATVTVRCLSTTTSDGDILVPQEFFKSVSVPGGAITSAKIDCPVGYKGITASYALDSGLVLLGHEPQPISRVFWLENTTSGPLHGTLDLVCLRTTLSRPSPFTTLKLSAGVGDTVLYKITVKNTGTGSLTFGALTDTKCSGITPGAGVVLSPGQSRVYTCSHTLTAANKPKYGNFATITGTPTAGPSITNTSNTVVVKVT